MDEENLTIVMAGLCLPGVARRAKPGPGHLNRHGRACVPAIHVLLRRQVVDARDKRGHDEDRDIANPFNGMTDPVHSPSTGPKIFLFPK